METLQQGLDIARSPPPPEIEPFHQGEISIDSPSSTLPLDESLSWDTENAAEAIIVLDDDDDDQAADPTSRPRRANRRQLDYSYPDYQNLMKAVAAHNPSRKRKRQKSTDAPSHESISVCIF
jgi:hypothetical protein